RCRRDDTIVPRPAPPGNGLHPTKYGWRGGGRKRQPRPAGAGRNAGLTAAAEALARVGGRAEPELRAALAGEPSAEVRRGGEALRAALDGSPAGESLRAARAVRVLERVGTAVARRVLGPRSGGDPADRLTAEAREALERMGVSAAGR